MITKFKPANKRLLLSGIALAGIMSVVTFTRAVDGKNSNPTAKPPAIQKQIDEHLEQQRNSEDYKRATEASHKILNEEVAKLDARIDDFQNRLEEMESNPREVDGEKIRNLERDQIRAEGDWVQVNRLWESLKSKSRSELRQVLPTAYRDEALDRYLEKLSTTEQNLTLLKKDYAETHPEVVRMTAVYSNINSQIEARLTGVLSGLETLVSARKAALDSLSKSIAELQKTEASARSRSRLYLKTKRDIEIMERIRDSLQERLIREEVELRLRPREMSK